MDLADAIDRILALARATAGASAAAERGAASWTPPPPLEPEAKPCPSC